MTREEAIKIIKEYAPRVKPFYEPQRTEYPQAIDMAIEALHREEAEEKGYCHRIRPKGEWIKKQVFNPELDKYVPLIECSVCGYEPYFGGSESKLNYCANCGAKMGGDGE